MEWHSLTSEDVISNVTTDKINGLSQTEAKKRQKLFGENQLVKAKSKSLFRKFLEQLCDFMSLLLIGAAILSFVTSYNDADSGGLTDCIIILAIVILNAIIGVVQESKAQKAIDALKELSAPKANVIRDGQLKSIASCDLVVGDIIKLSSGDCVPADARLIECNNFKTEESALTGESLPVEKNADMICTRGCVVGDMHNMVFSMSTVCSGNAVAVVTDIGMDTQVGQIASLINREDSPKTPLQVRLGGVSKALGLIAISICAVIFGIGVYRGTPILDSFILAISLAVAAIPEGLPAIVTIVLSIGVQRLAKKNAIIRRLPAVESLGGATVICSDKTGTLTQNKMTVCAVSTCDGIHDTKSERSADILKFAVLCSNSMLNVKNKNVKAVGEPTENAIVMAGFENGILKNDLEKQHQRIKEIPFDSNRKLMTTIHKADNGYLVITKGAPERVLPLCTRVKTKNRDIELTLSVKNKITSLNNDMASKAMRVIAVAYKYVASKEGDVENELVFSGLIGMTDPARKGVKESVKICKEAGITPVMITGDHVITAKAIADELGITSSNDDIVMTGSDLDLLSQESLQEKIDKCRVFARVSPEHKVKIVKAFRAKGNIVAMTGDGVNDAPALKVADIGCAMGKNGTDVAKSASDMILTDDNFSTIINAVEQGRGIYDNIKKSIHFLLSCNIGEILVIFASQLLNLDVPLVPIQLLWINLITDSLPAMALGVEKVDKNVMNRQPINPKQGIFANGLGLDIGLEGFMIGGITLFAFIFGCTYYSLEIGRTMAFAVLSISELVHAFNIRSEYSIFKIGLFSNRKLVISFFICLCLQLAVIIIAPVSVVFKTVALNLQQWLITAGISLMPLLIVEIAKLGTRKDR